MKIDANSDTLELPELRCILVCLRPETRMVKNSRPAPMKQSNLDRTTNSAMIIVLHPGLFEGKGPDLP